jgi:cellulose synthase operon protein C
MYQVLAKDMIDSERPAGLDELELEQYELLLEEQALPYEDQAIDILIANTDLVAQDIYDDWVKQSFAQLAKLLPGRFAKFEQVEEYVDIIY